MSDGKVRVVVVGCGSMARTWVGHALALPTVELVGLVDTHRPAAEAMAAAFSLAGAVVFDTLTQAIQATKPDAVFDITIPAAHGDVTLEALRHGCHVLGEKPMSDRLDTARQMVAAAEHAGKIYAVTQTRRPLAGFKSIAGFLQAGGLGNVAELHSDFYIGAHFGGFRDAMDDPLVLDMAIHTFDNARQLCGADPVSAYCHSWNPGHSWYKGNASALAIFEMTGGVVYTYRGSWCNEGLHTTWEADWRISGSHGSLRWDGAKDLRVEVVDPAVTEGFTRPMVQVDVPIKPMEREGHGHLIHQFIEAVRAERDKPGSGVVECPGDDNIKSLAMVLSAVESSRSGRRVAVEW